MPRLEDMSLQMKTAIIKSSKFLNWLIFWLIQLNADAENSRLVINNKHASILLSLVFLKFETILP